MTGLGGKRVLVVDDESLIALHAEDLLIELGAIPVGPANSLEDALSHIDRGTCDAVLLDANLNGRSSEPVARRLALEGIPFVIVTGYGTLPWREDARVLSKPYNGEEIGNALLGAISAKENHGTR